MGIDATGYTLGILTIGMSMVAVRSRNTLLTLGSAALWAALMAFILANTVAGATWQSMFLLSVAAFICAFVLIGRMGKEREGVNTEGTETASTLRRPSYPGKSPMEMSPEEYRDDVRRRLHPYRRR